MFLQDNWNRISKPKSKGISPEAKATGYIYPWNHDLANMEMICNTLVLLEPKIVLELGTFEACGTKAMADTLEGFCIKSKFWTFDEGGVTLKDWPESVHEDMINTWVKVVEARAERVKHPYQYVILEYIEGLTFDTLPIKLPEIGEWDFCFQDSVHVLPDILQEWNLLLPYSKVGSIIVFDDILIDHDWLKWFPENVKGWDWRHTTLGRSQLWAERMK